MDEIENNTAVQILKAINNFQYEMVKSMNYIRGDIHELKDELKQFKEENNKRWEENNKRWEENNKRWEENNKRWEENNRRWDENDRRWETNEKRWEKYEINRKDDRKYILEILTNYDISISTQLGDSNAEKMRKLV